MTSLHNEKGIILVVSGASGAGKGTVNQTILRDHPDEFEFSVSATTRAPRKNETNGKEYFFLTKEEFEKAIEDGEILEYTCYCGNYYGTPKSEIAKIESGKHLIVEVEVEGAENIKKFFPQSVSVFILPPDFETLKARLIGRNTNSPEDIERRLNRAKVEFALAKEYDYAVVNPEGGSDAAAEAIVSIVNSEKHKMMRSEKDFEETYLK